MVRVKNVESYLMYELVLTVVVFIGVILGKVECREEWGLQVQKLRHAFHLFMLDLDVEDFKQLKVFKEVELPSEQREKENGEKKNKAKHKPQNVAKQLQLFFLNCVEVILLLEKKVYKRFEKLLIGALDYVQKE